MTDQLMGLHRRLERLGVDALLFSTSEAVTSVNVRHLSGFTGSEAAILITLTERHLYTDGRYKTQATQETQGFRVHVVRNKLDSLARSIGVAGIRKLGIEASRVSHEFVTSLMRRVPQLEPVPVSRNFLDDLRVHKSATEKTLITKAAEIASAACLSVLATGMTGKREVEVAAALETEFRRRGAEKVAFDTIVASGPRSALPHGQAAERVIGRGELIVVDYGCRYCGYHSDETITAVTADSPSSEQKKIHRAVYEAHMRALDRIKPGVFARQIDAIARQVIDKSGYGKYFLHGLGHGVGLEIHEPPYLSPRGRGPLEEGMVFTVEPGIYIEGLGGIRLESLIYLDRNGPEVLSQMPKDLIPVA
jgi:Xaa-Pro aminopeptidase